jgi:hypothetical protein
MKSQSIKTPRIRSQPLARPISAFLSLPLRFKITIPYLVVAILLAGLATWVITQSFVNRLQERFNVQLESVQSWINDAASRFERSKQELSLEFNLTDMELQRLYDANRGGLPAATYLDWDAISYEYAT